MSAAIAAPSPWWYRRRALVIGAIYLIGFWPIAAYDAAAQKPYVPVVETIGPSALAFAVAAACACWLLRVWGSSYLRSATVWSPDARTDALVTGGPFAYTRNPLYLGNAILAFGLGAFAPPLGWLFINIAGMVFTVMLVRWEERGMRERYGARFDEYAKRVPQLFPRLLPAGFECGVRPSLREGLLAELFTAALFAGTLAVAVERTYGWIAFALLYVIGITAQTVLARRRATV